jgi:hypothetical protein
MPAFLKKWPWRPKGGASSCKAAQAKDFAKKTKKEKESQISFCFISQALKCLRG